MRDWKEYLRQQEIKVVRLDAIRPYENNPRDNAPAVPAVVASIERFGFRNPILVDGDGVIIEGHTRRLAALELGMQEVPVVYATDLTPDEVAALRVIDNKTSELAEWNVEKLAEEMAALPDFDFVDFGFDVDGILDIGTPEGNTDADDVPDVDESEHVRSKRGDVYELGAHRLMCGDSTNEEDVRKVCADGEADLWLTDPPYNVDYGAKQQALVDAGCGGKKVAYIANDAMSDEKFREFLRAAFANAERAMKPGATFYIFHADSEGFNFRAACRDTGLTVRQCLIWKKDHFVMGRQDYQWIHEPCLEGWKEGAGHNWYSDRTQTTVMEFDRPKKSELHPTSKPVALVEYLMGNSSKKGDVVLETFGGSGSTLMAAEQTGRVCKCVELDPHYCDVIRKRWAEYVHGVGCDWEALTPVVGCGKAEGGAS